MDSNLIFIFKKNQRKQKIPPLMYVSQVRECEKMIGYTISNSVIDYGMDGSFILHIPILVSDPY